MLNWLRGRLKGNEQSAASVAGIGAYPAAPMASPLVDPGDALGFPAGYPRLMTRGGVMTTLPTEVMPTAMLFDVYKQSTQGLNPVLIERILVPTNLAPNTVLGER